MNNADLYTQANMIHKRDVREYLGKNIKKMNWRKDKYMIMDIGSADGSVTNIIHEYLPPASKIVGCDISKPMVEFAMKNYSNEQIYFIVTDIEGAIPEEMKGTFDHIFSFYALNWVINQKLAFKNIFDLLEPNGECFMVLVARNPVFEVYRTLTKIDKWSPWVCDVEKYVSPYHDSQAPDEEITTLMENTGFVDVSVKCYDNCFLFKNEDMRKNLMSALCPFEIPADKHDEFIKDYMRLLDNFESVDKVKTNHSEEDVTLHYQSVVMYGRKTVKEEQKTRSIY